MKNGSLVLVAAISVAGCSTTPPEPPRLFVYSSTSDVQRVDAKVSGGSFLAALKVNREFESTTKEFRERLHNRLMDCGLGTWGEYYESTDAAESTKRAALGMEAVAANRLVKISLEKTALDVGSQSLSLKVQYATLTRSANSMQTAPAFTVKEVLMNERYRMLWSSQGANVQEQLREASETAAAQICRLNGKDLKQQNPQAS